jgi:hypothetical protein
LLLILLLSHFCRIQIKIIHQMMTLEFFSSTGAATEADLPGDHFSPIASNQWTSGSPQGPGIASSGAPADACCALWSSRRGPSRAADACHWLSPSCREPSCRAVGHAQPAFAGIFCASDDHKYRWSQQSSREVKPKFIDSTQGEPKNIYKP